MKIKVTSITDVTDLDYLKRRIEAMGFSVTRFDKELYVTSTTISFDTSGFQLAQLLWKNNQLVDYKVDDATEKAWGDIADMIKHTDTIKREQAEDRIRREGDM